MPNFTEPKNSVGNDGEFFSWISFSKNNMYTNDLL